MSKETKKGIMIQIIPLPAISTLHVYLQLGSIFYKLAKTEEKKNVTFFTLSWLEFTNLRGLYLT